MSKEKVLRVFLVITGILFLLSLGLIYFNTKNLDTPLILHFDQIKGIDLFGEKIDLWLIWFMGFAMAVINTFLGQVFFERERILSYIFIGTNILISILLLIVVGTIISVN
jgi:hypothetical protein